MSIYIYGFYPLLGHHSPVPWHQFDPNACQVISKPSRVAKMVTC